jgi:hypothetical protein
VLTYCCGRHAGNTNAWAAQEHASNVVQHIRQVHPFWNRTGGRDHVFWFTLDRGACAVAGGSELERAIKLVHFAMSRQHMVLVNS